MTDEKPQPLEEAPAAAAPELCAECGLTEAACDGICYQCQCELHSLGAYDMDGAGW